MEEKKDIQAEFVNMFNTENIELSNTEKEFVLNHLRTIEKIKFNIGMLRSDYLSKELNLTNDLFGIEKELSERLKMLAVSKGLDLKDWEFLPNEMVFRKIPKIPEKI